MENKEIKWSAPEFEYQEKDTFWYLKIIVGAVAIGLFAWWQDNLLFIIFDIIALVLIIVWGQRKPNIVDFSLIDKELTVGNKIHNFNEFDAFGMKKHWLMLKKKHHFSRYLRIELPENKVEEIKALLLASLEEIEYNESLTEAIADWLGF